MKIIIPACLLPRWLKSPAQRQAETELRDAAIALRAVATMVLARLARIETGGH